MLVQQVVFGKILNLNLSCWSSKTKSKTLLFSKDKAGHITKPQMPGDTFQINIQDGGPYLVMKAKPKKKLKLVIKKLLINLDMRKVEQMYKKMKNF